MTEKVMTEKVVKDFVRKELSWIADFLHSKFGISYNEWKQIVQGEMEHI